MSKRVFFRSQRARMRGNHETVKSPVREDDPYVMSPEEVAKRVAPLVAVQLSATNGQGSGRSVPDGSTVFVGALREDMEHLPLVRFDPETDDARERLQEGITGFLRMRSTSRMVNKYHGVDWSDLVDFLTRMGGVSRVGEVA